MLSGFDKPGKFDLVSGADDGELLLRRSNINGLVAGGGGNAAVNAICGAFDVARGVGGDVGDAQAGVDRVGPAINGDILVIVGAGSTLE
jgi:hypothetical protein